MARARRTSFKPSLVVTGIYLLWAWGAPSAMGSGGYVIWAPLVAIAAYAVHNVLRYLLG